MVTENFIWLRMQVSYQNKFRENDFRYYNWIIQDAFVSSFRRHMTHRLHHYDARNKLHHMNISMHGKHLFKLLTLILWLPHIDYQQFHLSPTASNFMNFSSTTQEPQRIQISWTIQIKDYFINNGGESLSMTCIVASASM
jgi:hypothetical protein